MFNMIGYHWILSGQNEITFQVHKLEQTTTINLFIEFDLIVV